MNYAVVDIETNGFTGVANKITEISIFIFDGEKVVDEFTTLINPESKIPPRITTLTGINDQMVRDAPKFYEVAKRVFEITEDCIFVAHSVNFDYGVISKEFAELGGKFKRKKLCTVRYTRKVFPGHKSYSLGNICSDMGIPIHGRHRARGDAEATVELLRLGLIKDKNQEILKSFLKPVNRAATLPPNLPASEFDKLPQLPGVYYFKDDQGKVIYVGKAKNIRQRIASHFHSRSVKGRNMLLEISKVDFQLTGNELIALLLESDEIKRLYPKFNRAQKRIGELLALMVYENQSGILQIASNRIRLIDKPILVFKNRAESHRFMIDFVRAHALCPKYCGIEKSTKGECFTVQLNQCKGVCCGKESIADYNNRLKAAIQEISVKQEDFVIDLPGRNEDEKAFVWMKNGVYAGYGYHSKTVLNPVWEDHLIPMKNNSDTTSIINSYLLQQTLPVSE